MRTSVLLTALLAATAPVAALAQSVPLTITFSGQVSNDPDESIMLRTYDPATGFVTQPFTGTVPAYAYQPGDQVTFTLQTFMPSAADLAAGRYNAALQPDGTYRIGLVGPNNAGSLSGVGVINNFDVSGPIRMTSNAGQPLGGGGLAVIIDPADYSFSLATDSGWTFATFDAPGYAYNPVTGTMSAASTTCAGLSGCAISGDGGFAIRGDLASATTGNMPIYNTTGGLAGFFTTLFSGSWSLPTYQPGGSTQVPEPGMLLLFGAGAGALFRRNRRRKADATTA